MSRSDPIPNKFLTTPSPLINRFADYLNKTTMDYVPQFSIQSALTYFGHLYGRQYISETGLSTAIYSMLVADSGIGKNYCKQAINSALLSPLNPCVIAGATSASGLFTALINNPNLLIVSDEIGDRFCSSDSLNKSYWRLVRELYSTTMLKEESYASRKNGVIIKNTENYDIYYPCVSILGMTTPGQLSTGLTENDVENGTINRMTIINALPDEIVENDEIDRFVPDDLMRDILLSGSELKAEQSHKETPDLKDIFFEKGLLGIIRQEKRRLLEHKNSHYLVRSVEKAIRMATIITISMSCTTISKDIFSWCLEYDQYWTYNIKMICNSINPTVYSKQIASVSEKIKSYGDEGIESWRLNRYMRETLGMETKKREDLINDLKDEKIIEKTELVSIKNGKKRSMFCYLGYKRKK